MAIASVQTFGVSSTICAHPCRRPTGAVAEGRWSEATGDLTLPTGLGFGLPVRPGSSRVIRDEFSAARWARAPPSIHGSPDAAWLGGVVPGPVSAPARGWGTRTPRWFVVGGGGHGVQRPLEQVPASLSA